MQPAPEVPAQPWASRLLDMAALVERFDPSALPPWRVHPFVLDGTLAIVAGKGGAGKTWVIHEAANAVVRGSSAAGMRASGGTALIIDAEMGEYLTTKRFSEQNYSPQIQVFNAMGLDLKDPDARTMVRDMVLELKPAFLGWDSLRALVPSAKENDSDDMGPVVTWIRWLTRQVNAGSILVHHAGWKEDRTRGSSAIKDQADAVWYMATVDDEGGKKLSCKGTDLKPPRWCEPPDDIYVKIGANGGLQGGQPPIDKEAAMAQKILEVVSENSLTSGNQIAEQLGINGSSTAFRRTLKRLEAEQIISKPGPVYVVNGDADAADL
jgi:hypothetical protein